MHSFQVNSWSEHEELKVVMLCAPSIADVLDLTIVEQVGWSDTVNYSKAMENFMALKNFINLNPETLVIGKQASKQQLLTHPLLKKKNLLEVDVTELEKGGGGIRCMTMPLVRT